jgi:Peptidogalycan biosysnthesis/recognition
MCLFDYLFLTGSLFFKYTLLIQSLTFKFILHIFTYSMHVRTYVQLLSAIPFTPATGSRLLFSKDLSKKEVHSLSQGNKK